MIRYKEFGIIPNEFGFDLVRFIKARKIGTGSIKVPNGETYIKEVEVGFGYTFESLIRRIAHLLSIDNLPQDPTLKDYLDEYSKIIKDINNILGKLP